MKIAKFNFENIGRQMGIAFRRKIRRDALKLINEDSPQMAWREKIKKIDLLTRTPPIYLTGAGRTTVIWKGKSWDI